MATIMEEKLDMSRSWIQSERKAGRFPNPDVTGSVNLWRESVVDAWLAEFLVRAANEQAAKRAAAARKVKHAALARSPKAALGVPDGN
ncbi:MAG TPA: hypothetical protein VH040_11100 [Usitatibacter sp.]|nr:hypothetical protein [Usitatibacter sp.]